MHRFLSLVVTASLLLGRTTCVAQNVIAPLSVAEKTELEARIYADVKMYFAHWEAIPNFDLNHEFSAYVVEALEAPDRLAFDLATLHCFAKLHNGHTTFYDNVLWGTERPVGFHLRDLGGIFVVQNSRLAVMTNGSVVRQIAGKPVADFLAQKLAYVPASSERGGVDSLFWMPYLFPIRFDVVLDDGRAVTIDRHRQSLTAEASRRVELRWIKPDIVVMRIPSFEEPSQEAEARRLLSTFSSVKVLILDVRGNSGGSTPERFLDDLIGEPWRNFSSVTPLHIASNEAVAHVPREAVPPDAFIRGYLAAFDGDERLELRRPALPSKTISGSQVFRGQVIVLSDRGCASACEDFVAAVKISKRGTIVGENSDGTTGQPFMENFGDGFSFRVSTKREYLADGTPFEGVGIAPDTPVAISIDDVKAGHDPAMATALDIAERTPSK
jgi:carboxyl-terminal processing protease